MFTEAWGSYYNLRISQSRSTGLWLKCQCLFLKSWSRYARGNTQEEVPTCILEVGALSLGNIRREYDNEGSLAPWHRMALAPVQRKWWLSEVPSHLFSTTLISTHTEWEFQKGPAWTSPLLLPCLFHGQLSHSLGDGCGCWPTGSWSKSCWHCDGSPLPAQSKWARSARLLRIWNHLEKNNLFLESSKVTKSWSIFQTCQQWGHHVFWKWFLNDWWGWGAIHAYTCTHR